MRQKVLIGESRFCPQSLIRRGTRMKLFFGPKTFFIAAAVLPVAFGLIAQDKPTPLTLDGLYIGRNPNGDRTMAYYFKPSGLVLIEPRQLIEPESLSNWKKVRVAIGDDMPGGDESFDLVLGTYRLSDSAIELKTLEIKVNPKLQLLIYQVLWKELWEKEKVETKAFRLLGNRDRIEIGRVTLHLQKDQTGRKLEGEYASDSYMPRMTYSGRAKFTADGGFTIDEEWMGSIAGGGNRGTGRYEVSGHNIIFRYADGRVESRLFGDLGKTAGKETVTLSYYIWIKGKFDN